MSTPPAKPWERARGGATPSSVDISAVAQQAAATQQVRGRHCVCVCVCGMFSFALEKERERERACV